MKEKLKSWLPVSVWSRLHRIKRWARGLLVRGNNVQCPCCRHKYRSFLSFSGIKTCECPHCGSLARHRLRWLFLGGNHLLSSTDSILHFAPEEAFQKLFNKVNRYVTVDIQRRDVSTLCDIQNLPFKDNSFGAFVCCHVLEHIPDDIKAIREMHRVLNYGGWGLIEVPIDHKHPTIEDPDVKTPEDRLRVYGLEDHLRMYGSDFKDRFERAGVQVERINFADTLSEWAIARYGLSRDHVIWLVTKQAGVRLPTLPSFADDKPPDDSVGTPV